MRMNKSIKSTVLVSLSTVMLTCLTMPAFAAGSYSTTTTYDVSTNKITVTSTLIGTDTVGEDVTFLVYKGDTVPTQATSDNILYIDQDISDSSKQKMFRFTTDYPDVNTTVKFGARTTAIGSPASADAKISKYDVPVTSIHGKVNDIFGDATLSGAVKVGKGEVRQVTIVPDAGYDIDTVNGVLAVGDTYNITGGVSTNLVVTYKLSGNYNITQGTVNHNVKSALHAKNRYISTLAKVDINADKPASLEVEYGILFSDTSLTDNAFKCLGDGGNASVRTFKALGKGSNGDFAVRLLGDQINNQTYYTRTYLVIHDTVKDTYTYSYGNINNTDQP